jgi:arabinose-5-phosphate isomerase
MKKDKNFILNFAKNILFIEAQEILNAKDYIDFNFFNAVDHVFKCKGRVILSGMGKSGHIARKISSTLSSTGTPSFFMHPGEASHGDLGMILKDDVVIILSNSGKSEELISILPNIKRIGAKIISITNNSHSPLAIQSDIHLFLNVKKEACPLGLAPTSSSTVALALGDAIALSVLEIKGFTEEDFARSHPGGNLGKNILLKAKDIMRKGKYIPSVHENASLKDGINEISKKLVGFTAIVNSSNEPIGIFTDGDLRRALIGNKTLSSKIIDSMTSNPIVLKSNQLAIDAVNIMEKSKINCFLITDTKNKLVGIINLQDLLKNKVI